MPIGETAFYNSGMASQASESNHHARGGTERTLVVLKELAGYHDGVSLDELSAALEWPKSSVHRALAALVRADLAAHPRPGSYVLGSEFVRLAYAHAEAREVSRLVTPCLEELTAEFAETSHYGELQGVEVVYLAKVVPAQQTLQMTSTIGGRNPAYCTGIGKALLAYQLTAETEDEDFLDHIGPLVARTPKTLVDTTRFLDDLRATRERGYSLDDEESELNINCIGFPLFLDSPSVPSGAISIAALRHRLPLKSLERNVEHIREIIRRHLGDALP